MTDQLSLNIGTPHTLVRASDPETSRMAAFSQASRERHLYRVLLAYDGGDMLTDVEAAEISGIDRIETTRRASELRNHKLIEPVLREDGSLATALLPTGRRGMLCRITTRGVSALRSRDD